MSESAQQYGLFNEPIDPNQNIPTEDRWLFDEPFHVFDVFAQQQHVQRHYQKYENLTRLVGVGKAVSRVVLKQRLVRFNDWETP